MQAIEQGKRLHYRDLHYQSIVPSKIFTHQVMSKGGHLTREEAMPWVRYAYPGNDHEFTPDAVAAFKKLTSKQFYPKWIHKIIPVHKLEGFPSSADIPNPLAFTSKSFVGIAPHIVSNKWIYFPLAIFDIEDAGNNEKIPITLYDEDSEPVLSLIVPKTGMGYYTDEKFVIHQVFKGGQNG